jgi:hypothetical protein
VGQKWAGGHKTSIGTGAVRSGEILELFGYSSCSPFAMFDLMLGFIERGIIVVAVV